MVWAGVERVEIRERTPFAGGAEFGDAGAYEQVWGRLHYAVYRALRDLGYPGFVCQLHVWLGGRIGGEEFAIILPEARTTDAAQVAERVRLRQRRVGYGISSLVRVMGGLSKR